MHFQSIALRNNSNNLHAALLTFLQQQVSFEINGRITKTINEHDSVNLRNPELRLFLQRLFR